MTAFGTTRRIAFGRLSSCKQTTPKLKRFHSKFKNTSDHSHRREADGPDHDTHIRRNPRDNG